MDLTNTSDNPLAAWMRREALRDGDVATRVGVSRVQVLRIRRGQSRPSAWLAVKLSELTGIPAIDLATMPLAHDGATKDAA